MLMPGWSKLSETLSMTRVTPPPGAGYSWTMSLMTTDTGLPPRHGFRGRQAHCCVSHGYRRRLSQTIN
jgi:hypothetical protein